MVATTYKFHWEGELKFWRPQGLLSNRLNPKTDVSFHNNYYIRVPIWWDGLTELDIDSIERNIVNDSTKIGIGVNALRSGSDVVFLASRVEVGLELVDKSSIAYRHLVSKRN